MEKIPEIKTSERIQLLKNRFFDDLTFDDYELREKIYQQTAAENPGLSSDMYQATSFARFLNEKSVPIHAHDLLAGMVRYYEYTSSLPITRMPHYPKNIEELEIDRHPMFKTYEYLDKEKEVKNYLKRKNIDTNHPDGALLDTYYRAHQSGMYVRYGDGHVIPGYDIALQLGIKGLVEKGEAALKNLPDNGRDSTQAMLITLRAFSNYCRRYAASARQAAQTTDNPQYKETLQRIELACEKIAWEAPESFFEAAQLVMLYHDAVICETLSGSISFGRFDYMLYPFYEADRKKGLLDFDSAGEIVDAFFLKLPQMREAYQNLTVGGRGEDGAYAGNEITIMAMRACRKLMFDQPLLSMRTSPDMPDIFWEEALALVETGLGFPALFNDDVVYAAKEKVGIEPDDLWKYGIVGCVEGTIGGKEYARTEELRFNWAKPIELMLNNGVSVKSGEEFPLATPKKLEDIASFDDFYAWYKEEFRHFLQLGINATNLLDETYGETWPIPFLSTVMEGCLENNNDVTRGATKYNLSSVNGLAMADAVDSLLVIKELVFERKLVTLPELAEILRNNFEGEEVFRLMCDNIPGRYGNDAPFTNGLMKELTDYFHQIVTSNVNQFGNRYQSGLYTVAAHVYVGSETGALPSGRKMGVSLANALSPCQGADRKSPTALIRSALSSDLTQCGNGMVLDIKFNPAFLKKPAHRAGVRKLIETYFANGGLEIQLNVVSRDTLIKAKNDPKSYRNLIVRVSGYSAYFYTMSPSMQDEIIARTEYEQ